MTTTQALFDIPAQPGDEIPRCTERVMLDALHNRFAQRSYNGAVEAPRYICAEHVRSQSGFDRRTADFVAVDTWASSKHVIHGVEVKVSRSDWLRELKDPAKAGAFTSWVHYWWLAAADASIVREGELPGGWGLLVMRKGKLIAATRAPRLAAVPVPPESLASLLRAVAKTAARRAVEASDEAHPETTDPAAGLPAAS